MAKHTCLICKNKFERSAISKYCSKKCYGKAVSKNHNLTCIVCKKIFYARNLKVKFCSHRCYAQTLLGKQRKGNPEKWKHTIESNIKNSLAHRGEKSNFWKGGKSKLDDLIRRCLKYRNWRTSVFVRDNYTCVWCGANKKYLNADHIKQFALLLHENNIKTVEEAENCEELWQINNGRTLCIDCHKETDTYLNKGRHYGLQCTKS